MIGLLEIIAGELQTGVTRFLAVSVKTFVLSVGSAAGLTVVVSSDVYDEWTGQFRAGSQSCNNMDLENQWWRLPLYILCSMSVLGQYRFTLMNYWAGVIVQVAAYETQYRVFNYFDDSHVYDGMDTVIADVMGAIAAVATASLVCFVVDYISDYSRLSIIEENKEDEQLSACIYCTNAIYECFVSMSNCLGLGRGLSTRTARARENLKELSETQGKAKDQIKLSDEDEATLIEAAVEAQEFNVWSLLMPAVYQLVPGSKLALFWYNKIFPPQQFVNAVALNVTDDGSGLAQESQTSVDSAEYALWLTSVSLALGLMLGLTVVRIVGFAILTVSTRFRNKNKSESEIIEVRARMLRQYNRRGVTHQSADDDPDSPYDWESEFSAKWGRPSDTGTESQLWNRKNGTTAVPTGLDEIDECDESDSICKEC